MTPDPDPSAEIAALRERLQRAESHTARTLMRATRLAQVISVLGNETDLETTVERAAVQVGELFFADMALLILDSGDRLTIAGHWGIATADLPAEPFLLDDVTAAMGGRPACVGPACSVPMPGWLSGYAPRHLAWARLLVGETSHGLMLLARRGDEPFEDAEETELRAVAHRIALAIENGRLQAGMKSQLAQLHRLQQLTSALAGSLEVDEIGRLIAETLVAEVAVDSSVVLIDREGTFAVRAHAGDGPAPEGALTGPGEPMDGPWAHFPLHVAGKTVGVVAVTGAPPVGSERHELLLHLVSLAALAIDKALLFERSSEQARHDSLTGLLGHRVFQEVVEEQIATAAPFSLLLFDIDDFKQVNDLHGHHVGDQALRMVADALRQATRSGDSVFRVGGEEFCALLPGLTRPDAVAVAEGVRRRVISAVSCVPNPITISAGVASYPEHGEGRDALLAFADAGLYASKAAGKNCTSVAGEQVGRSGPPSRREVGLDLLQKKDPDTVNHSVHVGILAVEIARTLGLGDERLEDLRVAARLHDIGKLGVPDAILNKPGPLDDDEFRIIKTHPVVGAELLRSWGLEGPARIVREHHERVDGGGYPAGLRGAEITLEGRIIHAADAYVAMMLDRPYRRAMGQDEAFAELERHSATQFDPDVVAALIALERPGQLPSTVSLAA